MILDHRGQAVAFARFGFVPTIPVAPRASAVELEPGATGDVADAIGSIELPDEEDDDE